MTIPKSRHLWTLHRIRFEVCVDGSLSPPYGCSSYGDLSALKIRHDCAKAFALLSARSKRGDRVFLQRQFAAAAMAVLLALGAFFATILPPTDARAALFGSCDESAGIAFLPSPLAPWKGAPLRVLAVAEKPVDGELSLIAPDGSVVAKSRGRYGGPPYSWFADVPTPAAGTWQAQLTTSGCGTVTREIVVRGEPAPLRATEGSLWPIRNSWNRTTENLYSAWIEKLFDAPLDTELSWPALHNVLRDRSRNFLFNYLSLSEDEIPMALRPDCADLVYFLRAYFAFKIGLPFGYSNCSRGGGGHPPRCVNWLSIMSAGASEKGLGSAFGNYLRVVADAVQSGSVRAPDNDNSNDFYMVPLTQQTLRPGVVYADPYGHVMMLVRRVPEQNGAPGVFLAVDGEPDGTVARKKFWRGNFLFAHEPTLGSPGFKRFRPIVRDGGGMRRLTNADISSNPEYGDFSPDQTQLGVEDFYDRMDAVMSPEPLDPTRAMEDAIASLEEQVKTRVGSIENGRKYQSSGKGDASMPDGPSIFATTGAWEDFATPARDFRLLIAIDVVRGYPDRVVRHPERYAMPFGRSPTDVEAQLQSVLASELASRKFSYTRSDGSSWTLTLKDVIDRAGDLEMAYNLNDCVELRWGAPEGSDEASTCRRHAPASQRAKMTEYRTWFRQRHWPARA